MEKYGVDRRNFHNPKSKTDLDKKKLESVPNSITEKTASQKNPAIKYLSELEECKKV